MWNTFCGTLQIHGSINSMISVRDRKHYYKSKILTAFSWDGQFITERLCIRYFFKILEGPLLSFHSVWLWLDGVILSSNASKQNKLTCTKSTRTNMSCFFCSLAIQCNSREQFHVKKNQFLAGKWHFPGIRRQWQFFRRNLNRVSIVIDFCWISL